MSLQDNVKIILKEVKEDKQYFEIVDKITNFKFVEDSILDTKNEVENADVCQDYFCKWVRGHGKTILENYYNDTNNR